MKKIVHHYGVELDWAAHFAAQLDGVVDGNFIRIPETIHTGYRYILECDPGISVMYVDVVYHKELHLRQENNNDDFVGLYYNLTEGEAVLLSDTASNPVGRWDYNLAIIDSSLSSDYIVKPGSHTFALCIFIKKEAVKYYFKQNPSLSEHTDRLLDPKTNTVIKFTRMSNDSHNLISDLRSKTPGGPAFDFYLRGTVMALIADYIEKMDFKDLVIETLNEDDLTNIIKSQSYLIDNLDSAFPGIEFLAQQANMSESKYKGLFKKITGITANAFFLNNKLIRAKTLLQTGELSIMQISDLLSFTNNSYFTVKFKDYFGMSPKKFIKQL